MADGLEKAIERLRRSEVYDVEEMRGDISDAIDAAMRDGNISNAEFARRLGTSRAYVTMILRGNANFTVKSLVKIARALGGKFDVSFHFPSAVSGQHER